MKIFIISSLILGLWVVGSHRLTKWEWEAGYVLRDGRGDCKARCGELRKRMKVENIYPWVCHGYYRGRPHRWLMYKGILLDPSQYDCHPDHYEFHWKEKKR